MGKLRRRTRGQALVEFSLVVPMFAVVFFGIIVLGIGVFYQQQLTNAAREAARYASIHSATAQCPTVSTLDPAQSIPSSYSRCDAPPTWPGNGGQAIGLTAAGRDATWGVDHAQIIIAACWSGYVNYPYPSPAPVSPPSSGNYDAPPPGTLSGGTPYQTYWWPCSIGGVPDPQENASQIACTSGLNTAGATLDTASDQSSRTGVLVANTVTVYACYKWAPPLAGFLLIPNQITQVAVVTQPIERQQ